MGKTTASFAAMVLVASFPVVCSANGPDGPEYEAAMKRLESQIREEEITEGSFKELAVGHAKDRVLGDLRSMGVRFILPDLRDRVEVTRAEDMEKLRSAEGLIVGSGDVVVAFEDDEVVRVAVARIFPKWKEILEGARTRDQVFDGLRRILAENPDAVVRSLAPDAHHVPIGGGDREGAKLLSKYDLWEVSFDDNEGHWTLRLEFERDRLRKIAVWHSPGEVP